jgi:hypothetical protein
MSFLRYLVGKGPRRLRWDPNGTRSDGSPATVLHLADEFPGPPFRHGFRNHSVTSKHERLDPTQFGPVAGYINHNGAKGHGRTLVCLDRDRQPIAALSYHLDAAEVLLVTAIAVLEEPSTPREREMSIALAGVLLCYLSRAAEERKLPARLGFAPKPEGRALAMRLGFTSARPPAAYADAGKSYMIWTPPRMGSS